MAVVQFGTTAKIQSATTGTTGWLYNNVTLLNTVWPPASNGVNIAEFAQIGGSGDVAAALDLISTTLWPARRSGAIPVMITLCDSTGSTVSSVTSRMTAFKAMGVISFAIYVGPIGNSFKPDLFQALLYGESVTNNPRFFNFADTGALITGLPDIVALACDAAVSGSSCGSCCGYCMCATCTSVGGCDDSNACTTQSTLSAGGVTCCNAPAYSCSSTDLCKTPGCTNNQCTFSDMVCTTTDPCNPAYCEGGVCKTRAFCTTPTDKCKTNTCSVVNGQATCTLSNVNCAETNKCVIGSCSSTLGCIGTAVDCNDNNPCTADTCEPATGCVYTPQDCVCTCDKADTSCIRYTCAKGFCVENSKCIAGELSENGCKANTGTCTEGSGCATRETCTDGGDKCILASCDSGTGVCTKVAKCTRATLGITNDLCKTPACNATTGECYNITTNCGAGDKCTSVACNPANGICVSTDNSTSCTDSDACTTNGICDRTTGCKFDVPQACTCDCDPPSDLCWVRPCTHGAALCSAASEYDNCTAAQFAKFYPNEKCKKYTGECLGNSAFSLSRSITHLPYLVCSHGRLQDCRQVRRWQQLHRRHVRHGDGCLLVRRQVQARRRRREQQVQDHHLRRGQRRRMQHHHHHLHRR